MKAGAAGYVLKTADREEFLAAIRTVASGGEYISDYAKAALIARLTGRQLEGEAPVLTRRELEIIKLIAAGKRTSEIAEALFISTYTVETHRRNLLQKLKLRNVADLVRFAIENGLSDEG
jgi:DNA-binding NarL/FixJ family response regulator